MRADDRVTSIVAWLTALSADGPRLTELRSLSAHGSARSAFFRLPEDAEAMAREAIKMEGKGFKGVYWTINPVTEDHDQGRAASDAHISQRDWVLLDIDPLRQAEISSDDEEKALSYEIAIDVVNGLSALGFGRPVIADSGNGYHLLYPVTMPNDEASREAVRSLLIALNKYVGNADVKIDTPCFNASRICRVWGTKARKGKDTPERPHRIGGVLEMPEDPRADAAANTAALAIAIERFALRDAQERTPDRPAVQSALERAKLYLGKAEPAVAGQRGHDTTFRVACVLVQGFALDDGQALEAIQGWNATCVPPWSEKDLRRKIEQAGKAPSDKSRGYLLNEPIPEKTLPVAARTEEEDDDEELLPDDIHGVARLADLKAAGASVKWIWPNWIARGVLTIVAANGGVGKTRFAMDLMRRVCLGLDWPDFHPATIGRDSRWLWMLADDNHAEAATMVEAWGLDSAFYLPALKADPFAGTQLDGQLGRLSHYMQIVKPTFFVVDTLGSATSLKMHSQEEAEALTRPLRKLAIEFDCAIICLTHLNANGGVLGRRIVEKARQVITMTEPDPEGQPNRRRIWVSKSNAIKPPALGVTMHSDGCDYDDAPPVSPDAEPGTAGRSRGRPATAINVATAWLTGWLSGGDKSLAETTAAAEKIGIDRRTLTNARAEMGIEDESRNGQKWLLTPGETKPAKAVLFEE